MAAEGGMPAYGYIKPKSGRQTVAGNDGTGISETEDWIETFPNGVFAFKDNAVYLKEGEKKEKSSRCTVSAAGWGRQLPISP